MNVEVKNVDITGNHCNTFIGNETVTVNNNGLSKEIADVYMKMIDSLMERNKELTDQLMDQTIEITKFKIQILQYEKEIRKLKELLY